MQLNRPKALNALCDALFTDLNKILTTMDQDPEIRITLLGQSSVTGDVIIHIASSNEIPKKYADKLRQIVREEMEDENIGVYVVAFDGQWLSESDMDD